MSDNAKNVIATLQQARRFYREVASLLQTIDAEMSGRGWDFLGTQTVTIATVMERAEGWLPYFAFRYYRSENNPGKMPFVAALFDYIDNEFKIKQLREPLLTAGWYDYGLDGRREDYILYNSVIHIYAAGWKSDGSWIESDPTVVFAKSKTKRTSKCCRSFAFPLFSFESSEDLILREIDPLVADVQTNRRS